MQNTCEKIFTILVILFPIINQYPSGIHPSIGVGDMVLLCVLILYFPMIHCPKLVVSNYLVFTIYTILISVCDIFLVYNNVPNANLIRVIRHGFYGVIICFYAPRFFELNYGKQVMRICACIASLALMLLILCYP